MSPRSRPFAALAIFALALLTLFPLPAEAQDSKVKDSFKKAGEGFKELGRKIGGASKEAGHEIAEAAKKVWYKGKRVSQPLLNDVQRATRKFWDGVIRGKDRTAEKLREENEEMRRELEEDAGSDEDRD